MSSHTTGARLSSRTVRTLVPADRCAACDALLDPARYARCDVCRGAKYCISCAREHLCTARCATSGCIARQAEAARASLVSVPTAWESFDASLAAAFAGLAREGCTGIVFGDIHLADVRAWYEERTRRAGLEHVEPIWGEPPADLLA